MEKITVVLCTFVIGGVLLLSADQLMAQPRNLSENTSTKMQEVKINPDERPPGNKTDTVPAGTAAEKDRPTEVKYPDRAPQSDENYLNTVTTTGSDGTKYRLVQIGDQVPRFYVNDELIPRKRLNRYSELITSLNSILWERQKESAEKNNADIEAKGKYNDQFVSEIVNDLINQKLITGKDALSSFRLSANEFTVNGQKQSFDVFSRFKEKYIKSVYDVYKFNSPSK